MNKTHERNLEEVSANAEKMQRIGAMKAKMPPQNGGIWA
jgi:hypothetical protein